MARTPTSANIDVSDARAVIENGDEFHVETPFFGIEGHVRAHKLGNGRVRLTAVDGTESKVVKRRRLSNYVTADSEKVTRAD